VPKPKELGPEPVVVMGDYAAAKKRAEEIKEFLDRTAFTGEVSRNDRANLFHLLAKWRKRANGEDWYFNHAGTYPRAYELLEWRMEDGLHNCRRNFKYDDDWEFPDPNRATDHLLEPEGRPKRKKKIRWNDPERTGFEDEKDISFAGMGRKKRKDGSISVRNVGDERTFADRIRDEYERDEAEKAAADSKEPTLEERIRAAFPDPDEDNDDTPE